MSRLNRFAWNKRTQDKPEGVDAETGLSNNKDQEFEVKVTTHCKHKALLGPKFGSKFNPYPLDPIYQWCWVAHLCSYEGCTPKAPLARKLKNVEITIANLQKWEAKQENGDVFPK